VWDRRCHGSRLGEFWEIPRRDYRLICKLEDNRLVCWSFASDIAGRSYAKRALQLLTIFGRNIPVPSHAFQIFTKFLFQERLLAARFPIKRYPGNGQSEQSAHCARSYDSPQEREKNARINRVANAR